MIREHRQRDDRRSELRYAAHIEIEWQNLAGRQRGTISDISETGCFVLCSGAVENGEKVKLYFSGEIGKNVLLLGEVVDHFHEIGFAVRFIELCESDKLFLDQVIHRLTQTGRSLKERH